MEWQRVSTYGAGTLQRVPNKRFVLVALRCSYRNHSC